MSSYRKKVLLLLFLPYCIIRAGISIDFKAEIILESKVVYE